MIKRVVFSGIIFLGVLLGFLVVGQALAGIAGGVDWLVHHYLTAPKAHTPKRTWIKAAQITAILGLLAGCFGGLLCAANYWDEHK